MCTNPIEADIHSTPTAHLLCGNQNVESTLLFTLCGLQVSAVRVFTNAYNPLCVNCVMAESKHVARSKKVE